MAMRPPRRAGQKNAQATAFAVAILSLSKDSKLLAVPVAVRPRRYPRSILSLSKDSKLLAVPVAERPAATIGHRFGPIDRSSAGYRPSDV